jgi:hypothetical protein
VSCLYPLIRFQHPFGGLFSPMEVRTDHLPMCTGPNGTCPSSMVLHIKGYTLRGLISHSDHSNVNHISSSILLNICIKSLIHQLTAQRRYTSLQSKLQETLPPPLFRSRKPYGTPKRVRYGPETPAAVPYGVSRNGNAVRYGRRRFGAVPRPYGQVSAAFKGKSGKLRGPWGPQTSS